MRRTLNPPECFRSPWTVEPFAPAGHDFLPFCPLAIFEEPQSSSRWWIGRFPAFLVSPTPSEQHHPSIIPATSSTDTREQYRTGHYTITMHLQLAPEHFVGQQI